MKRSIEMPQAANRADPVVGMAKTCPKDGTAIRPRRDPMGIGDEHCPTCDDRSQEERLSGLVPRANDVYGL
jgi:hypothetical protein